MRVVVTGGGSGGHIYPALAIANALEREEPNADIVYVGGATGMEARLVPQAGREFRGITTRKLAGLVSPSALLALVALLKGYREARSLLKEWRPDAAVGTGGYVAAATVLASARQGVPTIILSPDAVAGRTNRWVGRWAKQICLWLGRDDEFPAGRIVRTGLPIRPEVVSQAAQLEARKSLGLEDRFTVLVIGGSQGARRVNELVLDAVTRLSPEIQVLHQTGEGNFAEVEDAIASKNGAAHIVRDYFDGADLPRAYRAADLLICRCGVGMLAEGTANGLPLLMIPLPSAYADHQTRNARAIEEGGGGILLPQPTLTGELLAREIVSLYDSSQKRTALSDASRSLGQPEAANKVAKLVMSLP